MFSNGTRIFFLAQALGMRGQLRRYGTAPPLLSRTAQVAVICMLTSLAMSEHYTYAESRDEVWRKWQNTADGMITASIELRVYKGGSEDSKLGREEVNALLDSVLTDRIISDGVLDSIKSHVVPSDSKMTYFWSQPIKVTIDGKRIREDWAPSPAAGRETRVLLFDGDTESHFDPHNNQYSIFRGRSSMELYYLPGIYWLPPLFMTRSEFQEFQLSKGTQGEVVARRGGTSIFCDASSGFVLRVIVKGEDDRVLREIRNYSPQDHGNGVVFPTLSIDARYPAGFLRAFSMHLVENASFNRSVPADAFIMSADAERRVVDFREGIESYKEYVTTEPVENVVQFANNAIPFAEEGLELNQLDTSRESSGRWGRVVGMILTAIIVVVLSVVVVRRRWAASH